MTTQSTDQIFASPRTQVARFEFNEAVAGVFDDMVRRSVTGYEDLLDGLARLAALRLDDGGRVYDLGCSLGAGIHAIVSTADGPNLEIIGIDSAPAMVDRANELLASYKMEARAEVLLDDLTKVEFKSCDLVVLNLTLQFLAGDELRLALLRSICEALEPGGILFLSEKIAPEPHAAGGLIESLHERFKADQGYSQLEIAQKRAALENVLIADSDLKHRTRLRAAGFSSSVMWYRNLTFASYLAVK